MIKKRTYIAISLYAMLTLFLLIVALVFLLLAWKHNNDSDTLAVVQNTKDSTSASSDTEEADKDETSDTTASIFQSGESNESKSDSAVEDIESWIVKAYMGQIGIFREDGSLEILLDTNIKNLPKADQDLLEEGFEIYGKKEFNAIIEDYGD